MIISVGYRVNSMNFELTIFGVEKDGSFNSSINAIYQSAFGEEVYKSIEEKLLICHIL